MNFGKKISEAEYDAHSAIRSSTLKLAYESLAKFKAKQDGLIPSKESDAFDIGKAVHAAVLEHNFSSHIEGPDEAKNTKIWKEFEKSNPGKICLQPHNFRIVKGMYDAFFKHPLASRITNKGKPEFSFFATIGTKEYKARTDYVVEDGASIYIVDHKTAADASPDAFRRAIENYGYDISAAHYIRVIEEAQKSMHGDILLPITSFIWIVQEKEAPFEIAVYRMDDDCRARALAIVNSLYSKIDWSYATNTFESKYPAEIRDIDVPYWTIQQGKRDVPQ